MFIGEFQHNIDDKGRLAVPSKFRSKLSEGAVVTRGLDSCLFLYTKEEWQKMAEKISDLPVSQSGARAFSRLMLAGAMEVDIDKQGRVILPAYLREYAGIKKEVVVAGLYSRIEIWSGEKWSNYKKETEKDSNEIAEQLGNLGI
ncbi:MAG: Protein MraZ [candidate division CPR2 bacterium GW2011_GWC1_39_9]|uniref:Transcriptional regulator MraZ n=1 Tax=candidate division CPR2 bacterium GW2011_GWC2_39_10 TaxID=1618345 RepID=A0A0G0LSE4_UNCC2|nr:MAG: Protein MraZ [candidate division CPR2 bacterium GW2011_GWC2_39_10]KKR34593.1 MAG: Protein MraZ [candidate division CPR2 bacterium GW2011_GWC1_39_9]